MTRSTDSLRPHVLMLLAVVTIFVYRASIGIVDPDMWHEMALAREIVASGQVPWSDHFAYTPTVVPCVHHEWGAGIIAYTLSMFGGPSAIVALKWGLALGLGAICWMTARGRGASFGIIGLISLPAIFVAEEGFSPVRAQMYSFLLTALLLSLLDRDQTGRRRWMVAWAFLFVGWLNLHAGFLVGGAILFVHWLEQLARRKPQRHLLVLGIVMLGLIIVNPWGWHYYSYLLRAVTMPRPRIDEWLPIWESARPHQLAAFALCVMLVAYAVSSRSWNDLAGLPVVIVTGLYAVRHGRMMPFFAIAVVSYLPGYLQTTAVGGILEGTLRNLRRPWSIVWLVTILVLCLPIAKAAPWKLRVPGSHRPDIGSTYYPVGAVEYLQHHRFRGNVMVPFDHGAYVSWRLFPAVKVSIDSRYEVAYPPDLLEENLAVYLSPAITRSELKRYPTDAILVPTWTPLAQQLRDADSDLRDDWQSVYRDDAFELYVSVDRAAALPLTDRCHETIDGEFP